MLDNTCWFANCPFAQDCYNAKDQANNRGRLGKNALWDISVGLYLKYCVMQSNISVVSKEPVINTIDFIQNPSEDAN